ncbi:MAG: hypothetical protein JO219_06795 [Candidatus Eremiobacteraeota bacterium]|nr:hypothetical protein [Candidatus Eremiobacteraeota bacterium]MBV8364911.1 hypothetical protein [Candidatus Eremiobacteraeota bacterium]
MSWEALTAVGTLATAIVILITVIVGWRQLDELRRATQLEGAMRIFAELDSEIVDDARKFVTYELPAKMQDPQFRKEIELTALADPKVHKELVLLRFFDRVGTYVEEGLIEGDILYKAAFGRILSNWQMLYPIIEIHRRVVGPFLWKRFEMLKDGAARWVSAQGISPEKGRVFIEAARKQSAQD